jgi:hypothetical protein
MKNADEGSETIEGTANRSIAGLDKVLRVLSQAARLIRDKGEAVYDPKTGQRVVPPCEQTYNKETWPLQQLVNYRSFSLILCCERIKGTACTSMSMQQPVLLQGVPRNRRPRSG